MQFLEVLLDSGKTSISEIEAQFVAFQKESGFSSADMAALKQDDFEKLVIMPVEKKFDLALRKYITKIDTDVISSRVPRAPVGLARTS